MKAKYCRMEVSRMHHLLRMHAFNTTDSLMRLETRMQWSARKFRYTESVSHMSSGRSQQVWSACPSPTCNSPSP